MQVLSNGYKLPETGDFGDSWFPALEDNIQRLNDHVHDGTDSNKLPATSVQGVAGSIIVANFSVQPNGEFRALVSVPVGGLFDEMSIAFRDPTTKEQMYVRYEKFSVTQFYVFINIVQDVEVLFTT